MWAQIITCLTNQMAFCVSSSPGKPRLPTPVPLSSEASVRRGYDQSCSLFMSFPLWLVSSISSHPPPPPPRLLHPLSSPFGISSISLLFIHHSVPSFAFQHTLNPRVFHTLTKALALNAEHTMIFPRFTRLTCSFLHYGWECLKCLSMNPVHFLTSKNMPENCILPD